MALIHMDGFDAYSADDDLLYWSGYLTIGQADGETPYYPEMVVGGGRFGGNALWVPWQTATLYRRITSSGNQFGLQVAFRIDSLSHATTEYLLRLWNNSYSDLCLALVILSDGSVVLRDADNSTVGTSDAVLESGQWHYMQLLTTIGASGTVRILIDGAEIFNETAVKTTLSASGVDQVSLYGAADDKSYGTRYDDLVLFDGSGSRFNALLGDKKITTITVDGDTAQEDFNCSTGSDSYAMVDDPLPGSSDEDDTYLSSSTVGHKTRVTLEALPNTLYNIEAVAALSVMKKDNSGTRTGRAGLYSNSVESDGAEITVAAAQYRSYRDFYELDPDGDGIWTSNSINSLEIYCEVVS